MPSRHARKEPGLGSPSAPHLIRAGIIALGAFIKIIKAGPLLLFRAHLDIILIHQGGVVGHGQLPEVQPHHFQELFRRRANLLEYFKDLGNRDF